MRVSTIDVNVHGILMTETTAETTAEMTIDELARVADVVVSTVRLYQNRGLLPPPTKRGRVGYYDRSHLGRLRLIAQLQDRGFSLAGIRELLDGMDRGQSLGAVLGLGDRPSTWTPEEPRPMPLAELAGRLPQMAFTPEMVGRIVELGLVEFSGDATQVVVRSPSFLEIGGELAALGVPPEVILDQYEALRGDAERIARRFTEVFRTHLWEPFVEAGMPAERITEMIAALEKLGPLAEGVVVMSLRHALQDLAERFVGAEAERLGVDIPRPGQGHGSIPT
jgi:DNA-binding transcriptional MerR regulator